MSAWKNIPVRGVYWDQLEEKAKAQGRSVANYLEQQLLAKGIVKKEQDLEVPAQ
jgi:hypothetical protein